MQEPMVEPSARKTKRFQMSPFVRSSVTVAGAIGIFLFGWGLGSGRITFGNAGTTAENAQIGNLDYRSVDNAYELLKANFDGKLDVTKLNDGLKEGLAKAAGDPYTEYFSKEEYKEFDQELSGSFTGIGAELTKDKDVIEVVAPIAGYPADKAGMRPKDVIAEIDGKAAYDLTVSEAVKRIRGPKDTVVKIKIIRGGKEEKTFEITRANISIPSVEAKVEDGVGYLKISRFGDDTAKLTKEAAQSFKQQGAKGIVLDMRNDPGGLLDAAVAVSKLWLEPGKTILTERHDGEVTRTFTASETGILKGMPTAVLINDGSASASEIVAGALKDNNAAVLVGKKSYGKGSVQQLARLKDGSMLKVTVARWYTPAGKNIDKAGLEPDTKVELSEDDMKNNRDPQKDAAYAEVRK